MFRTTFICLLALLPLAAHSSDGTEGHGGIDILLPNGASMPIEAYVEFNSDAVVSVCDLVEAVPGYGDADVWRENLNTVVAALHRKLPAAADMLTRALQRPYYRFLKLSGDAQLIYTNDDGSFVAGPKFNGALRVGDNVYISKEVWKNYWTHREPGFDYSTMLTRIVHEALLSNYVGDDKLLLGEAVIEILRNARFFAPKNGPKEFRKLTPEGIRMFLITHDIYDTDHAATFADGREATLSSDFKITLQTRGDEIDRASHQNGTYETVKFKRMNRLAERYLEKEQNTFGGIWNGNYTFAATKDLLELRRFLKTVDSALYTKTTVESEDYFTGGILITKNAVSPQVKKWSRYVKGTGIKVCE